MKHILILKIKIAFYKIIRLAIAELITESKNLYS